MKSPLGCAKVEQSAYDGACGPFIGSDATRDSVLERQCDNAPRKVLTTYPRYMNVTNDIVHASIKEEVLAGVQKNLGKKESYDQSRIVLRRWRIS